MQKSVMEIVYGPEFIEARRRDLVAALDFVNAEIEAMDEREFLNLLHEYAHFMVGRESISRSQFLAFAEKYEQLSRGVMARTSPNALRERKQFFIEVQSHLRSKIEAIMEAVETGENRELLIMPGKRSLIIMPFFDCFVEGFSAQERKGLKELAREILEVELWLVDITSDLGLKAKRFRKCVRCQKIFYHTTSRKKLYCSKKCAGAVRQARHLERKISGRKRKSERVSKD